MATAPVKSQPLHNFYLPFLKWGNKNQTNANHRYRNSTATEHRSSSSTEQELDRGDCSKSDSESWRRKHATGSRSEQRNRSCSSQRELDEALEGECDGKAEEADESVAKTRKLRPRKGAAKASIDEIGGGSIAVASEQNENLPKSSRLRGFGDSHGNGKSKLWVSLSREEIEEDVYSITGSRASRRPKKRTKTLQKLIDNISPGFYLIGASADSYRAFDNLWVTSELGELDSKLEAWLLIPATLWLIWRYYMFNHVKRKWGYKNRKIPTICYLSNSAMHL